MTPRALRWNEIKKEMGERLKVELMTELFESLERTYECPRCGRRDLPLYFFHEHNSSCKFETALGGPAIEKIEELQQDLEEADDTLDQIVELIMERRREP